MKKSFKIFSLFIATVICVNLTVPGIPTLAVNAEINCYDKKEITTGDYTDFVLVDKDGNELEQIPVEVGDSEIMANLPAEYDLRDYNLITDVKYQEDAGACWAFSAIGSIESNMIKQNLASASSADYSEAHLIWFAQKARTTDTTDPTYGDGENDADPFVNGGNWTDVTYTLARGAGVELESNYPFYGNSNDFYKMNYDESKRYSSEARLMSVDVIAPDNSDVNNDAIKTAIYNGGAIGASYYSNDSRYSNTSPKAFYQTAVSNSSNHAIMIVGWDDSFASTNFNSACRPSANGAWLCRNSWSTYWGDGGYFWISYQEPSLKAVVQYKAAAKNTFDNIYQYDGIGWNSVLSISGASTAKSANVFTANGAETLTHVGFSTYGNSAVNYKVEIYLNVTGTTNPTTGTKITAATVSGSTSYYGYHTVALASPVELSEGQKYSVVVTMTDVSGENMQAPVESDDDAVASSAVGRSFLNFGGSTWYDTSALGYNDTCVKAMTKNPAVAISLQPASDSSVIIDSELMYGIAPGTSAEQMIASLAVTGNAHVEMNLQSSVGTGTVIKLISDDMPGTVLEEYTAIVFGDLSGDGAITSSDMTAIKASVAKTITTSASSPTGIAADLNGDGVISVTDYTLLKSVLAKTTSINQSTGRVV